MKNKKGFVMTETLVVTVFLVTIFTFVYISIVPLMGVYDDMSYRNSDIDIVYKLYHIRRMVTKDSHKNSIIVQSFKPLTCSDLDDENYCNELMDYLELRKDNIDNYILIYTNNIHNNINSFRDYSLDTKKEIYNYLLKKANVDKKALVLLDVKNHTIAHLVIH